MKKFYKQKRPKNDEQEDKMALDNQTIKVQADSPLNGRQAGKLDGPEADGHKAPLQGQNGLHSDRLTDEEQHQYAQFQENRALGIFDRYKNSWLEGREVGPYPKTFRELFIFYYPKAMKYSLKIVYGKKELAEESVGNAFLKLLDVDPTTIDNIDAYVYKTVRNCSIDALRKKAKQPLQEELTDEYCSSIQRHPQYWHRLDWPKYEQAIKNALSEKELEVFMPIIELGITSPMEIAEHLGLEKKYVENRLYYGRKKLRCLLPNF
ncbi:MAG: sigma-70 family RNA polymerase sigma factor [Saprospiraceae bacterium]